MFDVRSWERGVTEQSNVAMYIESILSFYCLLRKAGRNCGDKRSMRDMILFNPTISCSVSVSFIKVGKERLSILVWSSRRPASQSY